MDKTFYWIFGLGVVVLVVLGVLATGYAPTGSDATWAFGVFVMLLMSATLTAALLGGIAWAMRNGRRRLSTEERERLRAKFRARSAAPPSDAPSRRRVPWLFLACSFVSVGLLTAWVLQGGFRPEALLFMPGVAIVLYVIYLGSREQGWESRRRSRGIMGPTASTVEIKPCSAFRWHTGK